MTFTNRLSHRSIASNRLLSIGSGVALGDIDGDGWVDIYLCGLETSNALYRNLGQWRFEEIAASAGVDCPAQWSIGAAFVDLDGDGDLDLLVNSLGGGTRCFFNQGSRRFQEEPRRGFFRAFGATSFGIADLEGDGDLDVYVTNYRTDTFLDRPPGLRTEMRPQPDGSRALEPLDRFITLYGKQQVPVILERGEVDVFYLNLGGARFRPIPWQVGLFRDAAGQPLTKPPTDWGLSVLFRDLNGDGHPDLYVCNDFVYWPDRLWLNQAGRFLRAAPPNTVRSVSLSSMAVDVADINHDGFDDLFVAEMLPSHREARARQRPDTLSDAITWPLDDPLFQPEVPRNTLHLARGDGTFAEIAIFAGVAATDWTTSALFLDVDLDGWEDILAVTGNSHDVQDMDFLAGLGSAGDADTFDKRLARLDRWPHRHARTRALRNTGNLHFEEASRDWQFDQLGVAHGMALGDLDNDGDLDVVVNAMNEPARILRNNAPSPRVGVRLRGMGENSRGIGARITLRREGRIQSQEMVSAGRFASSDDPMRVFALGSTGRAELEVRWRDGRRSLVRDVQPNRVYEIDQGAAALSPGKDSASQDPPPLFQQAPLPSVPSSTNAPFDDFARQPLLPHRLSTLGPSIAWVDLNADGHEDLIVGGSDGQRTEGFLGDGAGRWTPWSGHPSLTNGSRASASLLLLPAPTLTHHFLVIGESSWESPEPHPRIGQILPLSGSAHPIPLSAPAGGLASTGPLAAADCDGDGDLDLFVGGHALPGRYPESASSYLLRQQRDHSFRPELLPLQTLVNGALFTDFDDDGDPDALVACEWDSPRILRNDRGSFVDTTSDLKLDVYPGRWNGVAVGDFDEDGAMDFVASNWGRNWRIDQSPVPADRPGTNAPRIGIGTDPHPVFLYYGKFAADDTIHTLLASMDPVLGHVTPWRDRKSLSAAIPTVGIRFPSYLSYSRASLEEILGQPFREAKMRQAWHFESTLFLNRRSHFEPRPLPAEAQFSPAFGICAADFDGDGHEDLFLAQNFFGVDAETSRHDAGHGLILRGDGRGGFQALRPGEAGISIEGEQRSCAVADYDRDGRLDLAVAQRRGPVRLFHNRQGAPGVRVRLVGPAANPACIGARIRLRFAEGFGNPREIHAGSGFRSQDSAVLVLPVRSPPRAIHVRWPDGRLDEWPWPDSATSISLSAERGPTAP